MNKLEQLRDWRRRNPEKTREQNRKQYHKNPSKSITVAKKWRLDNMERYSETQKSWRAKNVDKRKEHGWRMQGIIGLTIEIYNNTLKKQKGLCKICRERPANQADHNHKTGKFRGILCVYCNSVLGFGKDSIKILSKAIEYLKKNKK